MKGADGVPRPLHSTTQRLLEAALSCPTSFADHCAQSLRRAYRIEKIRLHRLGDGAAES